LQRIGDFVRQEIAAGKMLGAIILIQQHGRPVYFECFGVRDVEGRRPMIACGANLHGRGNRFRLRSPM
jgi:hypothetical protein